MVEGGRRRRHEDGVRGKPDSGGNAGGKVGGLVAVQAQLVETMSHGRLEWSLGVFQKSAMASGRLPPIDCVRHHGTVRHHDCVSLVALGYLSKP